MASQVILEKDGSITVKGVKYTPEDQATLRPLIVDSNGKMVENFDGWPLAAAWLNKNKPAGTPDIDYKQVALSEKTVAESLSRNLGSLSNAIDAVNPISGFSGVIDTISDPGFWKRAGVMVVGGLMVILGTQIFISNTSIGKKAQDVAMLAATKGMV